MIVSVIYLWYRDTLKYVPNLYISSSSSSSNRAISTDIPDPLSLPLPIVHCFRQVFRATSHIGRELQYVGSSRSSCLCSAMWRGPQQYITYIYIYIYIYIYDIWMMSDNSPTYIYIYIYILIHSKSCFSLQCLESKKPQNHQEVWKKTSSTSQNVEDKAQSAMPTTLSTILPACTGCLNIHGTYVTANNSTNNNVVFFFVSDI